MEGEGEEEGKDELERSEKKKRIKDNFLDASSVSLVRMKYMSSLSLSLVEEQRSGERV